MVKKTFLLALFVLPLCAVANIRLPAVLSSNMVLQQQSKVKLWGWAWPGEKIVVTCSWKNVADTVTGTRDANFELFVQTPAAGGPYTITFKGQNTIVLDNVLIGEVWVCSGQSNMEWNYYNGLPQIKEELPFAHQPNIRLFHIPKTTSTHPQDDCVSQWTVCDSNTLKAFSGVAYFFAKHLNQSLNVPIGLINASWGGTPAEVWAPAEAVNNDAALKAAAEKLQPANWWPYLPGRAYNAMIAPVTQFAIAGAIWYQGESNTGTAATYSRLLTTMIDAWREAWNKEFPFYYVQIAPYRYGAPYIGALLQEQQTRAMQHPKTGMVVIHDLVEDTNDIHPRNKRDVGIRLANYALAETYGKTGIVYKSPFYKGMEIAKGKITIEFDNAPNGLAVNGKTITQLLIAGSDQVFYPAQASIEKNKLVVWSKQVKDPVAVRYAFGNTAIGNLFSKEGLPVAPFRTDDWE